MRKNKVFFNSKNIISPVTSRINLLIDMLKISIETYYYPMFVKFKNFAKISWIRLILFIFLSISFFYSFKQLLFYEENKIFFLIFFLIEIIIILSIFYKNYILYNLLTILFLNLVITPIFFRISFDLPYRQPNSTTELLYSKNFRNNALIGFHKIETDEMGFRVNKKINYTKKDKNTFRAIAIGASTTEEEGLDQNKIWTNLLIKKIELKKKDIYENFEMINMGVGGLRAIHHYFSLVRNLKLNPDLVIFLIGINDWNYHIMQRNRKFTFQYYEYNFDFKKSLIFELSRKIKKSLKGKLFKYNHISTTVDNKNFNYYEDLIIKNTRNKNKSTNIINFSPTYVYYEYEFWLNAIINTCKKNNINCIFVDQPSLYNIKTKTNLMKFLWMNPPFVNYKINFSDNINIANLYNEYLSKEIRKNNLNFCKISDKIYPDMINFIDDVHFTPVGSELVAKSIFNCMNNK